MERFLEVPKVRDILTRKVIAFRSDYTQFDAIRFFNKYRISTAPVVNENNEVIGYLSEGDCIRSMSNSLFYDDSMNNTVDLIMSKEVGFADDDWDIFELEYFFAEKNLRSAPVIDSKNHLVGIVTRRGALMALEKVVHGRNEYKKDVKTPIELDMKERIKIIILNRELELLM